MYKCIIANPDNEILCCRRFLKKCIHGHKKVLVLFDRKINFIILYKYHIKIV